MQSALYKEPYEKGLGEGMEKGIEKGRKEEKVGTIIRFLTKRFGPLPLEVKNRFPELDLTTLDVILDRVYEYKDLDEVKKYIQYIQS